MKIRRKRFFLLIIIICVLVIVFYNNNNQKEIEKTIVQSEIVINGQTISNLEQNITVEPRVDENTGVKYITYDDLGAMAREGYDDYNVIKETHELANQNGYEVRAEKGKTYHIYRLEGIEPINIQTNTDWDNANFVIHDENIADLDTRGYAIFHIISKNENIEMTDKEFLNSININKATKSIKELSGYGDCLCFVYNDQKIQYIRSGMDEDDGKIQQDIFKIDNSGNVLNEIEWDFDNISKIILIPIEEQIYVKNGNFETCMPENGKEQNGGYYGRNIKCYRSNVKISNINHTLSDNNAIGGPYYGFIRLSKVADVIVENCKLVAHPYRTTSNYDLIIDNAINITLNKITSDYLTDNNRWGITGTNYTKDVTYKNCELNRLDAHCGVHNLTIENCIIGIKGLTVIGSGDLYLKNVTRKGGKNFMELRLDYGSTWNGDISIENCIWETDEVQSIVYFKTTYENGELHDYGYELYLPNLEINGLNIESISEQNSDVYIFNNSKDKTGTDNGDMRNNFNLPQNVIVKNYQITSGKKLKLFSNKFYSNLEEIGINLSMPLSDKTEIEITNKQGEKIEDQTITNKDIKINKTETEGITTTVKINNEIKNEKEINLKQDGIYKIEAIYQNSNGESERKAVNVTIDKTSPSITGITQDKSYKYSVIPKVYDANLKEIKLVLNGEEVKSYKEGNELTEEGYYQLTATDKAENTKTISFYIVEPGNEDYKIINNNIENIGHYTKKSEFSQKFAFSKEYDILRNNKVLSDSDYIATGDILKTKSGEEYTLIVAGDINKDGKVDIKDIVKLRKFLVSPNSSENKLDEAQLLAADTNIDKKSISIKDLVRMRIIALTTKE